MSDMRTIDRQIDISHNNPPEHARNEHYFSRLGSVTASAVLLYLMPDVDQEIVLLRASCSSLTPGDPLEVEVKQVLEGSDTLCSAPATCSTGQAFSANTDAVFSTTRLTAGIGYNVALTSTSGTVTDVFVLFITRPLLGSERQ